MLVCSAVAAKGHSLSILSPGGLNISSHTASTHTVDYRNTNTMKCVAYEKFRERRELGKDWIPRSHIRVDVECCLRVLLALNDIE